MNAGRLSDRISFEARILPEDEAGPVTWAPDFELQSEAQRNSELSARFIIRYRTGITPATHRIIWDGCIWNIVDVVHDRKRRMMTIDCGAEPLVESTTLQSTEREYIVANPAIRPRSE